LSPYRTAPRQDRGTTLKEDFEWSRVDQHFWDAPPGHA
jgi:hypothetical protein